MSFFSRMFEAAPTQLQKAIDNVMEPASGGGVPDWDWWG